MQQHVYVRHSHVVAEYGRLVAIEPVEIQLYEEGAVVQTELMVVGVPVVLGEAVYHMNFFVVPKGSFEYIAGNAFAATFDVCPRVSKGYATIAIKQQYLHAYGVMPHTPWWSYSGLYWFVRSSLSTYVKKVWENQHVIWLKLELPCGDPWFIAAVYLPPQGSVQWPTPRHREDAFDLLKEQVLQYQHKGHVYVVGDFNPHVGANNAVADAAAEILDAVNEVANACYTRVTQIIGREIPSRASMDLKRIGAGGRFLLKLCQEADCVVLNGRTVGDEVGAFTHHKLGRDGRLLSQSVFDYGLCNRDAFVSVKSFKVRGFDPVLSDHCMLCCELDLPRQQDAVSNENPPLVFPHLFLLRGWTLLKHYKMQRCKRNFRKYMRCLRMGSKI